MASLVIEKNEDGDATLRGGRNVVHRWSIVLSDDDRAKLIAGEPVPISSALPDLTVKHLFMTIR